MKVTQMPPVHPTNLVANSDNTAYGVDVIITALFLSNDTNAYHISIFEK